MVFTYEYDSAYPGPPMPIADIRISGSDTPENYVLLSALVDSGADATFIPVRYLKRIEAKIVDKRRMRDASDLSYQVDIYAISLSVGPFSHQAVEVIANRYSDVVILGRDVLNHLIVTLNGLANVVEISD